MNRMKWIRSIAIGVMTSLLFCGCGNGVQTAEAAAAEEKNSEAVTFTDDLGREVTVENPKRVAALLGSYADLWYLAGGTVVASADDAWDDFELPLPEDAVNLGMTKKLSLEKLFEADPDFVLASTNTKQNVEWKETLEAAEIDTAYFDVSDFEDYLRVLDILTDITGRKDLYETNGTSILENMQETIAESKKHIADAGKAPKVLVIRASASMILAKNSQNNVMGEMLHALGCENIADSDDSLLENLSLEHIMVADPDHIFVCQYGDDAEAVRAHMDSFIAEHPAWSSLKAVKEGNVHYMDKALYTLKPNDRWAEAYEKAEELLFHE